MIIEIISIIIISYKSNIHLHLTCLTVGRSSIHVDESIQVWQIITRTLYTSCRLLAKHNIQDIIKQCFML